MEKGDICYKWNTATMSRTKQWGKQGTSGEPSTDDHDCVHPTTFGLGGISHRDRSFCDGAHWLRK